jgi:hypothetical protein
MMNSTLLDCGKRNATPLLQLSCAETIRDSLRRPLQ